MKEAKRNLVFSLMLAGLLTSCSSDADDATKTGLPTTAGAAVSDYAQIVEATYADAAGDAEELDSAVQAFVTAPSEASLKTARAAWIAARETYLQSEVFRFYDGPIDNADNGPEGMINAWPLDEAYIDYVEGDASAGIINDPSTSIDTETLMSLNEQGGEENIATGFHAIEFLLWGQDFSATGPGDRSYQDYLVGAGASAANGDRRGKYLTTVSELLAFQLAQILDAWRDNGTYRTEMIAADPADGLRRILTGMIVLSGFETGGERLQTALDSGDQEDEHSCFSDNTHRDMVQDVQGIQNVWLGSYTGRGGTEVRGVGIQQVVQDADPALAQQVTEKIAASLALANALQPPFDQEIALGNTAGRARVEALIVSLREQEKLLEQVFRKLNLDIPQPE